MSRWKAAAIHLLISALVALLIGALLLGLWYPPPFFQAGGAERLLLLIVAVDVILGPLLTLIVFRSGKPSLRFDLSAIALVQTIALAYGLHAIVVSRPVFLVAAVDRFVLVAANDLTKEQLDHAPEQFRPLSWTGPRLVAARMPTRAADRNELLMNSLSGKDLEQTPKYYVDYASEASKLLPMARPLEALAEKSADAAGKLAEWESSRGVRPDEVVWLPIVARDAGLVMLLRKRDGRPLDALPIDPW